jgi:CheY-like chemotaxis protein
MKDQVNVRRQAPQSEDAASAKGEADDPNTKHVPTKVEAMKTILVVDDDHSMLQILKLIFERAKYRVIVTNSSVNALDIARTQLPDVILLDEMMPYMNGSEVCRYLKNDPRTEFIPIVIFSAGTEVLNASLMREIRADAALRKPSQPQVLLATIQKCLAAKV